jgi:thioester reductase-like protein
MLADSVLPSDIHPHAPWRDTNENGSRRILLTGATGFLGAHLLSSLMQDADTEIVCLVRPGPGGPVQRIKKSLLEYEVWNDCFERRIEAFNADLTQPRLGLSPLVFDALTRDIDTIFHSAASVNWIQPYSSLRLTNVLPLKELLRLACRERPKPFHFLSTLGVCYSSRGAREIDETEGTIHDIDGIPLAYAQSKLVAETLVRTANERGLPATIFRPSFITGDSTTGLANHSDFISALIKGCIQMSAAPDLDWNLDAVPVDFVAKAISRLALEQASKGLRVFHLANPKPRHWRELVLWMNLYGYTIRLMPYAEWLARFERIEKHDFALRHLLPFFQRRLPQHYEEAVKRRVRHDWTSSALRKLGLSCPGLSTTLMDRYFESFVARAFLESPKPISDACRISDDWHGIEAIFGCKSIESAEPIDLEACSSVINELTSWKYGNSFGLHAYRVKLRGQNSFDVVLKIKAPDGDTDEIGRTIASLCGHKLGTAYARFSDRLGIKGSNAREIGIYEEADKRLRRFVPRFYGAIKDEKRVVLALERLSEMTLMNAVYRSEDWTPSHINTAIDGLSEIHSVWYGRETGLVRRPWLGLWPTRASMQQAMPLWVSLAEYAAPMFSDWTGGPQSTWIQDLAETWARLEQMPRTLIHNDFNPRNIAFRQDGNRLRLCVYDWELAAIGVPQHDLAELLCFVLGPDAKGEEVRSYIERHRQVLAASSGRAIDGESWIEGFRLSLANLMIQRLPLYAMIHRFQPQPFLERVVRTWRTIYESMQR